MALKNNQIRAKFPDLLQVFDAYYNGFKENKFVEEANEALVKIIINDIRKT